MRGIVGVYVGESQCWFRHCGITVAGGVGTLTEDRGVEKGRPPEIRLRTYRMSKEEHPRQTAYGLEGALKRKEMLCSIAHQSVSSEIALFLEMSSIFWPSTCFGASDRIIIIGNTY